jgi:hypothetical protein
MDGSAKWLANGPGRLESENATTKTRTSLNIEILSRFTIQPCLHSEKEKTSPRSPTLKHAKLSIAF